MALRWCACVFVGVGGCGRLEAYIAEASREARGGRADEEAVHNVLKSS